MVVAEGLRGRHGRDITVLRGTPLAFVWRTDGRNVSMLCTYRIIIASIETKCPVVTGHAGRLHGDMVFGRFLGGQWTDSLEFGFEEGTGGVKMVGSKGRKRGRQAD